MEQKTVPRNWLLCLFMLVAAVGLRWMLDPWLRDTGQYTLLYLVIALTAVFAGWRAGLIITLLGGAATFCLLVFLPGHYEARHTVQFVLFAAVSVGVTLLAEWGRRQAARAAEIARAEKETEERFRLALAASNTAWWHWDFAADILSGDERVKALLGLAPGSELTFSAVLTCAHADDRSLIEKRAEELRSAAGDYEVEFRVPGSEGTERWLLAKGRSLAGDNDRPAIGMGILLDMTERKLAEKALEESRARLRITFDKAGVGIVEVQDNDRLVAVNDRACVILGYSREELLKMSVPELTYPEDRALSDKVNSDIHQGVRDRVRYEKRYLRKDGTAVWAGVTVSAIRDEQGIWRRSITTIEDISERKRAENALRDSEAQFRTFFENSAVGASQLDADGRFVQVNDRYCAITGYSREELLGIRPTELSHPDDKERDEAYLRRFLQGDVSHYSIEKRYIRKGGEAIWVRVVSGLVRDANGRPWRSAAITEDITARKQAEDELKRSELFFRQTLESIPGMVFTTRPDGYCDYQSQQWEDFTGVPLSEHLGYGWNNLLHPDDRPRALAAWRAAVEENAPYDLEYRVRRHDGVYEWFKVRGQPIRDENGRIVRWFGVAANIEALKQAEDALRRSEQRFRGTFDNAAVGITHTDAGGRWLRVNRKLCEILGYASQELVGKTFRQTTLEEDMPEDWEQYKRLTAGEVDSYSVEKRYRRKDGSLIWIAVTRSAQRNAAGEFLYAINMVQDVSQGKRAEEELRESESRFRQTVEALPQLIWTCTLSGECDFLSSKYIEYTGIPAAVQLGHGWLDLVHPDDRAAIDAAWQAAAETGRYAVDFRLRRHDGVYRWFHTIGVPVKDAAGRVAKWFGSSTDIEEIKQIEKQLRTAQVSAERAKAEAERANAAKDEFLAVLSHELRTPLAPVLAGISLIRKKQCGDCSLHNELEVIQRNIQLEARLIDDLLDLTRIARGKISLERKPLYLCTVLERVADVCRADIEARRMQFSLEIKDGPHRVNGDISRLQQVFWNLLNNAVKFTPDGGRITIRTRRENTRVIIDVSDSGIGVEPDAAARIFDAFEQASARVTRQFGGLGLGLAITKRLVEMHYGEISVSSAGTGRGSTFQVVLPIASDEAHMDAEKALGAVQTSSRRILLVEDHADTAMMMKQLLEVSGYEVETAANVSQSLAAASANRFDLLISDIGLPDKSGLQLMEELRRQGSVLPGIALSGYGREDDVRRSIAAGFSAHLTKPVDVEALIATVEKLA